MRNFVRNYNLKLIILLLFVSSISSTMVNSIKEFEYGSLEPNALLPIGTAGKEWTLEDVLTGQTISFSSFEGKAVVMDFFATWCIPCQQSMPDLVSLKSSFSSSELAIISVNTDVESNVALEEFASTYNLDWYLVKDTAGLSTFYGISSIPTIYVFDVDLKVYYRNVGAVSASFLSNLVNAILNIGSTPPTSNPQVPQNGFWAKNWYWFIILLVFVVIVAVVFIQRRMVIQENKRVKKQRLMEKRRKQMKRRR